MRINRNQLRSLVESVLLEGFKDDQRYLADAHEVPLGPGKFDQS